MKFQDVGCESVDWRRLV